MGKHKQQQEEKPDWVKIGSCLYRYRTANYYALVRFKGKQIRHCLETDDLELARRKRAKFKTELAKTTPVESRRTIKKQAELFLAGLVGRTQHQAWVEFLHYRKSGQLKLLQSARIKAQLKKLSEMGHDIAREAINTSIANGWQGIFPPKGQKTTQARKAVIRAL